VLDVGTGSGVLAISAAQYFPSSRIIASDNDSQSGAFVAHNAALNGVEERITPVYARGIRHATIAAHAPYDLLLCNISMEAITPMLRSFHALTHPESLLLFSGMQLPARPLMQDAVARAGFRIITVLASAPWYSMLVAHEPPPPSPTDP
jgi:ribosomal protein L11 methyltransferase